MNYLILALHCEARPLIRHLTLRQDVTQKGFAFFHGADTVLAVTGIGKLRSAIAVSRLLTLYPPDKQSHLINLGVCGASRKTAALSTLYRINQITDISSGRACYPDMLIRQNLPEAPLETSDIPVHRPGTEESTLRLYDMEGSGFYEAARKFVSADRIHLLKIVSDYLEVNTLSEAGIANAVEANLPAVLEFLAALRNYASAPPALLSADDINLLNSLSQRFHFTAAQQDQLANMATSFVVRSAQDLSQLQNFGSRLAKNKQDSARIFEEIKNVLTPA